MKGLIALLTALFTVTSSWAQPNQLIIQGETGKLYLNHTVSAKENWYSVGRLYNISPKEIAPFNSKTLNTPLEIGKQLKIPLKSSNFSQNTSKSSSETLVPVYHIIQEKEWMYHISTTYNKVAIDKLEKWNNINKDQAKAGMQLIVGFLKVKTAESAFANMGAEKTIAVAATVNKDAGKPIANNPVSKDEKNADAGVKKSAVPSQEPVTDNSAVSPDNNTLVVNTYSINHAAGGFFGNDFGNSNKSTSGQAGTFKSTSGWHDGKYYALMNNVSVGTIIKVTSISTNKSIYAKVLGQLPQMKESTGLAIRISNSAAAELGTGEGKFPVDIRY